MSWYPKEAYGELADDAGAGAAAVTHLAEITNVAEAQVAGQLDLVVRFLRIGRQPVHFRQRDARVIQRIEYRGAGQLQFRFGQLLAEGCLADARYGRLVLDH